MSREQVYIHDEDDNRKRYSNKQSFFIRIFVALAIFIILIIYLFLPPLSYLILLPPLLAFFTRRDRKLNTEEKRLQYYLAMIPKKKKMKRTKFHKKIAIPVEDLKQIEKEFPEITGNNDEIVTASEMVNSLTCWYNKKIKRLAKAEIRDIIEQKSK